jgi:hypothetical protein
MKRILGAIVLISIGVLVGGYMAIASVRTGSDSKTFIHNGTWRTSLYVGAQDADPHIRAYVAAIGMLGLSRKETIYFQAYTDDEGNQIDANGIYEIIGRDLPTRWWSLTLYNHDHFLTPNPYNKYSVKGTEIEREADGSFRILLARDPQEGNWIPMGEGHDMSMSIRLYNPDPGAEDHLQDMPLPSIRRIGDAS